MGTLYLYIIYSFMKQMLQAASNYIFNQLFPNAHNNECQNLLFPFQQQLNN